MEYLEQMQSGFKYLVSAGEAGRRSIDGIMGPVNGAISEITGAVAELENVPFLPPGAGKNFNGSCGGLVQHRPRSAQWLRHTAELRGRPLK